MNTPIKESIPIIQRIVSIAWPSFLVAGLATILFFTLFDPHDFLTNTRFADTSRLGAYTIGFFCFWTLSLSSSMLTCYFRRYCHDCPPKENTTQ